MPNKVPNAASPEPVADLIAQELKLPVENIRAVIKLLDEGNTVPFIARYRKEQSGNIDDQQLRQVTASLAKQRSLAERRADILRLLAEQNKLSADLEAQIQVAPNLTALEDIYRPYRSKRRTRAVLARERGLEGLAEALKSAHVSASALELLAQKLVSPEQDLPDSAACLQGALDIVAEELADTAKLRAQLRSLLWHKGKIHAKQRQAVDSVFRLYYDFKASLTQLKPHRTLALNRGEKEGYLLVKIDVESEQVLPLILAQLPWPRDKYELALRCATDSWQRLLLPSLENEIRRHLTEQAEAAALQLFARNLRAMLLAPPLRDKTVLALDPGYRHGCKLAVTNAQGELLETAQIYPVKPQQDRSGSQKILSDLIHRHQVDVLALGNGTATRETEDFLREFLDSKKLKLPLVVVNEAGASVYSASALAAAEFPQLDVALRSSVSLARRLQDPLAELVKIEPAALGVGQYQHDLKQKDLASKLGAVVEDCVNQVGCDLNTASAALLSYIAGITPSIAKAIVSYRQENGRFGQRQQLMEVPRLGLKTFEQCAGFLRIADGEEVLDNSSVHPESYAAARLLLQKLGGSPLQAISNSTLNLTAALKHCNITELAAELKVGVLTLQDIAAALDKKGRDGRCNLELSERSSQINSFSDLHVGLKLKGMVRNVTAFGAFVDLGLHQDGLIHISELADCFVQDPCAIVQAGQAVEVVVLAVDEKQKRISLSMKPSRL